MHPCMQAMCACVPVCSQRQHAPTHTFRCSHAQCALVCASACTSTARCRYPHAPACIPDFLCARCAFLALYPHTACLFALSTHLCACACVCVRVYSHGQ